MEILIDFTDMTLLKTEGIYEKVVENMKGDVTDKWCLVTKAIITSPVSVSVMNLDFYYDGKVVITEYNPSNKDVFYNVDIEALNFWMGQAGWKTPSIVTDALARENFKFWQHFKNIGFVQSHILEKESGNRDYT